MLSSAVCLFMSRPLFAYIVILILSVFLFELFRPLIMLMDPFQQIMLALRVDSSFNFWMCAGGLILVSIIISFTRWEKRLFRNKTCNLNIIKVKKDPTDRLRVNWIFFNIGSSCYQIVVAVSFLFHKGRVLIV